MKRLTFVPWALAECAESSLTGSSRLPFAQVVTYKWLARQYAIPSNYAKKCVPTGRRGGPGGWRQRRSAAAGAALC